ncbi:hypothetical protein FJT64_019698 [Amphibalanus amphitrite]|uniref:Leucine-rich repeat domain-containing protein n=1 Tax=Amphibalanus amphitrite TaxID=1232801 RepID=A0A6A4WV52_AMPAM|nr:hypothetical protein FJT64_019698 [Amphibalanus amphitrite]
MPDIGSITFPAQVTTIPSQLRGAIIRVGPNIIILPAGVGDSELTELQISRETVERLSVTTADLPRLREQLPEGLRRLNVRGPKVTEPRWPEWDEDDDLSVSLQGVAADTISHLADLGRTVTVLEIYGPEVTEPSWPGWDEDDDLSVSLQGVAADTISQLPNLGRTVTLLEIYDCPDLTAGSLEPLTRCPELRDLILSGGVPDTVSLEPLTRYPGLRYLTLSGGVPDAVLDSLSGCPGLQLVKSCRELCVLYLHCTADTGRAVLTALKKADLGRYSDGRPRTIRLYVPGELYDQLKSQEGGRVRVREWLD